MAKRTKNRDGMRVRMVIYSDKDGVIAQSDEPFYESDDELTVQAWRLLEKFEDKIYGEPEMEFFKPGVQGETVADAKEGGGERVG